MDGEAAPFGAASTASSLASAPPCRFRARFARPAVAIGRAYRSMVVVVARPHVIPAVKFWGPLLVPGSLCSPACGILSFFLGIFRGGSCGISSSHCWSLLNWRHLSVFQPASAVIALLSGLRAGDCGLPLLRMGHARVWVVACPPLLRERRATATLVPLMSCALAGISFRSILASSRLSLAWWIRRACAGLLLPRPLGACRSPLRLFTGRFLFATVVSS